MLHLIGVDHQLQHNGRAIKSGPKLDCLREQLSDFLRREISNVNAKYIVEENNHEVLLKFGATESIPKQVAEEAKIAHVFCEPTREERLALGITEIGQKADFAVRESFWLERIRTLQTTEIIFVLGALHVDSFTHRARAAGFSVNVTEPYFAKWFFDIVVK